MTPLAVVLATLGFSAAGFGGGVAVRRVRARRIREMITGSNTFAQSVQLMKMKKSGLFQLVKTARATGPAADLWRTLEAWAVLVDTMIETWGPQAADAYRQAITAPGDTRTIAVCRDVGRVLYAYRVIPAGAAAAERRKAWDADPAAVVARARALVDCALAIGASLEKTAGTPLTLGKDGGPSVGDMAESWATEEAIGYLVEAVPGGAAVLAVGQALGGPGWHYGITSATEEPNPLIANWQKYRAVALEAAADLLAYALV